MARNYTRRALWMAARLRRDGFAISFRLSRPPRRVRAAHRGRALARPQLRGLNGRGGAAPGAGGFGRGDRQRFDHNAGLAFAKGVAGARRMAPATRPSVGVRDHMVRRSELQYLVGGPQLIVGELAEVVVADIAAVPIRLGRLAIGAIENFLT